MSVLPLLEEGFVFQDRRAFMSLSNQVWTQEKAYIEKYTQNWCVKGEFVKRESVHVDYSHEERIHTVLIIEKYIKHNMKGSCRRKGKSETLASGPP